MSFPYDLLLCNTNEDVLKNVVPKTQTILILVFVQMTVLTEDLKFNK